MLTAQVLGEMLHAYSGQDPSIEGNSLLYDSMTANTHLTIGKGPGKARLASMLEQDGYGYGGLCTRLRQRELIGPLK